MRLRHKEREEVREGEKEERIGLYRETKREAETEGDSNWAKERKRGPVRGSHHFQGPQLPCLALPLGHCIGQKTLAWKVELLS